jgi:hypothetical protein
MLADFCSALVSRNFLLRLEDFLLFNRGFSIRIQIFSQILNDKSNSFSISQKGTSFGENKEKIS